MMDDAGSGPRQWDRCQILALAQLERALAAAAKAKIAICGMDDTLLAYHAPDFDTLNDTRSEDGDIYNAQRILCNERDEYRRLNDHGAYRDSGGW